MNSTELRDAFRDEMGDVASPPLWSDAAIFRYMDDAQNMFCRFTEGLEDARTASVVELTALAGEEWLPISPLITKFRMATLAATGRELRIIPMEKASVAGITFNGSRGPVYCLVSGFEKHALRVYPIPVEDTAIHLSVFRLPLVALDDEDMELEIDRQHHTAMLLWMQHLAYGKQDSETFDRSKSDDYEGRFMAYCAKARTEQNRARHPAGTVVYGGL